MENSMFYLTKTSFEEISEDLDNIPLYYPLFISSLNPEELKKLNLEPYEYWIVEKVHFEFQKDEEYSVLIRYMSGSHVELKGIDILSDQNVNDYDLRQYGMRTFIEEYYEKHMQKNSAKEIYYFNEY